MVDLALGVGDGVPRVPDVAEAIRAAILDGRLAANARLPGGRTLATQLCIARSTVAEAYEILASEGYVVSRQGSGTYVSGDLPDDLGRPRDVRRAAAAERSPAKRVPPLTDSAAARLRAAEAAPPRPRAPSPRFDLRPGRVPTELFPFREWRAHWNRVLTGRITGRACGELGDDDSLRRQIATYIGCAHAVRCVPEQIIVTVGAQQALDLIARLVLEPGDAFAFEDPSYLGARRVFQFAGGTAVAVPVDGCGMDMDELKARSAGRPVRLVYVTPSHQFPTGSSLSLPRRLALLSWAAANDAWIVEDDYNAEFRFTSRPLPSLQGLDQGWRTIYIGTFAKAMHPAFGPASRSFPLISSVRLTPSST